MLRCLGSLSEAEAGKLQVFVGGPAPLAERWTPLLSALGSPVHVGPLGAGASAKLVANATLFGTLSLLGEVVAFADGLGLSRDVTFHVLAATPLAGPAGRRRPSIEEGGLPAPLHARAREEGRGTDHRCGEIGGGRPPAPGGRPALAGGRRGSGLRRPGLLHGPRSDHRRRLSGSRPVLSSLSGPDRAPGPIV